MNIYRSENNTMFKNQNNKCAKMIILVFIVPFVNLLYPSTQHNHVLVQ